MSDGNKKTLWSSIGKFWIFLSIILIPIFLFMIFNTGARLTAVSKNYEELNKKMSTTNWALNQEIHKGDSLNRILSPIANYLPMAAALQYRDSICSKLPHSAGDVIRLKPDSSKWVIKAISITGGKWQHTVTYILRDSTSSKQIEVEPETVY